MPTIIFNKILVHEIPSYKNFFGNQRRVSWSDEQMLRVIWEDNAVRFVEEAKETRTGIDQFGDITIHKHDNHFSFEQQILYKELSEYILLHAEVIESIKWFDNLKENITITTPDFINSIAPFDNSSFWMNFSHLIEGATLDFINLNVHKVCFSRYIDKNLYVWHKRQYFEYQVYLGLSANQKIDWNMELLNTFKEKWDWTILSSNESIPWDAKLINEFSDVINFSALSSRANLNWTAELLDEFSNKWDWKELSVNAHLPWGLELLKKFENKWVYQPVDSYEASRFEYIFSLEYSSLKPKSISHNSGINWSHELAEFIPRIDIWSIAANAFMSATFVALVNQELSETRIVHSHYTKRCKDDYLELEHVEFNGWDLIEQNKKRFYSDVLPK